MERSIIIIGAGTAGLSAGCYARMNGYRTTIFEMGEKPGGLCTSWRRGGYLFDGSVAGLAGAAPGSPLFRLWQELGVAKYCPLHFGENFGHICHPDGRTVTVYTDVEVLEAHLFGLFPRETKAIREFTNAIRAVLDLDPPFQSGQGVAAISQGITSGLSLLTHLPTIVKYGTTTIRDFSNRFQDPFLQSVFDNLVHFGGPDVPLLTVLLLLAYAHRKMAGIPVKGWLSFARSIERRYLDLGGTVHYRAKVERLWIENGVTKGVMLSDGSRHAADIVLSAADGHFSNFGLLGREDDWTKSSFQPERLSDQPMQINLGVAEDTSGENGPVTYLLPTPFSAGGREHNRITVHTKYYDPGAAPTGKSAVTVFLDSTYRWWKEIEDDPWRYETEKENAASNVIDAIGLYRPGFRSKVEVIDVSTPLTRERFTANWMGAMQARAPAKNMIGALLNGGPRYAFKDVTGYYTAGQWVEPWGGITTAAQSGRKAVAAICRHDRRHFMTTVP